MGGGSSSPRYNESQSKINHPKIKQLKIAPNSDIMHATLNVEHEDQFYNWESRLNKLKNFDQYYLLLPKAYSFSKKGVCGSSGLLQVDYDNYPFLLHQQIQNRAQNYNFFSEPELWYLFYGLCTSAFILKKTQSKIGDVQSKNIFLNPEGQVKVSNVYSWPSQRTNYQKLVLQNIVTYVSPQELQLSKQGRIDIYQKSNSNQGCNKYVSESFSIGLTMLEAAILTDNSSLYDIKNKSINLQQLSKKIAYLLTNNNNATAYSKSLRMAIASMCEISPEERLQAVQLYDLMRQNDSQIGNLRPCNVPTPSVKNKAIYERIMGQKAQNKTTNQSSPNLYTNYKSSNQNTFILDSQKGKNTATYSFNLNNPVLTNNPVNDNFSSYDKYNIKSGQTKKLEGTSSQNYGTVLSNYSYGLTQNTTTGNNIIKNNTVTSGYSSNPSSINYTSIQYDNTNPKTTSLSNPTSTNLNTPYLSSTLNTNTAMSGNTNNYSNIINTSFGLNNNNNLYSNMPVYGTSSYGSIRYDKPELNNNIAIGNSSNYSNISSTFNTFTNKNTYNDKAKDVNSFKADPVSNYTNINKIQTNLGSKDNIGPGNSYLNSIYSVQQSSLPTPTFSNTNNKFDNFSFNNQLKQTTKNTYNYTSKTEGDDKATFNFSNSIDNKLQPYSFSNISSIPYKSQLSSTKKQTNQNANVNMFTPSNEQKDSQKNSSGPKDDSSLNLLRRINDDIEMSRKKFD